MSKSVHHCFAPGLMLFMIVGACASAQTGETAERVPPVGSVVEVNETTLGRVVVIQGQRPELEPGRVFAGNDVFVTDQVKALNSRPMNESAEVIAEIEALGVDRVAPLLLLEYAQRKMLVGDSDWQYWSELASLRGMYDARACNDRSAGQFLQVALMGMEMQPEFIEANADAFSTARLTALRQVIDSGAAFNGKASAWWICSHGISNMTAANEGRALTLEEWWVGEEALSAIRAEAETAITGMLAERLP